MSIQTYTDFKLQEDLSTYSDPLYGNDVFKIRYRQLGDLSNKRGSDLAQKPQNNVLDKFQEGDIVSGLGIDDEKKHSGKIVTIQKDSEGEGTEVTIEEDGEILRLAPGSVQFSTDGEKGHRSGDTEDEYDTTGNTDLTMPNFNTFQPFVYEDDEKSGSLKNIKKFSDFE